MDSYPPQPSMPVEAANAAGSLTPWTLWAKWSSASQQPNSYHPLLCHLIDVAQCAEAMWRDVLPAAWKRHMADELGLKEPEAERWIVFWSGLHDLGKACPGFQLQLQDSAIQPLLTARLQSAGLPAASAPWIGHGDVSAHALRKILSSVYGMSVSSALEIALAVGGHHGRFPSPAELTRLSSVSVGQGPWDVARQRYTHWLAQAIGVPETPPRTVPHSAAMALAGFVSVVDWIGSSEIYFHHAAPDARIVPELGIADYVQLSRQRAHEALTALGWTGWKPSHVTMTFPDLFDGKQPRPLQQAIVTLAEELTTPAIVVIEAPMGEGKTEAAMYLADRWTSQFGQRGIYFALPSQASSDQMFQRISDFLASRYPRDIVNAQLLHGHAALSATLRELRARGRALLTPAHIYATRSDTGVHANAPTDATNKSVASESSEGAIIAAEWFSSGKRALLAPFGVGTVDQALLAALQTMHVFVRLYGLSTKTIIIDEVHAYDTYMLTLLRRLMEWLGALHAPVILLSATLPSSRRRALVAAYARGAGWERWDETDAPSPSRSEASTPLSSPGSMARPQTIASPAYPRVTWASSAGSDARPILATIERRQSVTIEWLLSDSSAITPTIPSPTSPTSPTSGPLAARLSELLENGGCAAVICNTVASAQQVYRTLAPLFPGPASDGFPQLDLLHARFPLEERGERERRALLRFGRQGPRPHRAILVATQVIEQSLDLDFDLMATDLAPGDLVLQRLGRMHRHERRRPTLLDAPRLIIQAGALDSNGVPTFDSGSEHVYDAHILLRSWLALRRYPTLTLPDDIEPLVEAIYEGADCPADASPELRARWEKTLAKQRSDLADDEQQALQRYIGPPWLDDVLSTVAPLLRDEDAPELHPAFQALTRLTELNVTVACFGGSQDMPRLRPDGPPISLRKQPDLDTTEAFLKRSLTISDRRVVHQLLELETPPTWKKSSLLRRLRPLYFGADGATIIGKWRLILDRAEGLRIENADPR